MATILLPAALLSACSQGAAPPQPAQRGEVEAGRLQGDAAAPVLRLRVPGREAALALDVEALESVGTVRASLYDPHAQRTLQVEGVTPAALHRAAMAGTQAAHTRMVALDDYAVEFAADELESSGAILATKVDGKRIPIEEGGPVRLVFTDDSALGENPNLWIWSVNLWETR